MTKLKLIIFFLFTISFCKAQYISLAGVDKMIVNKTAFNSALNKVDNNSNRFFYKESKTSYIFKGTDADLDADNKTYIDIKLNAVTDEIELQAYTYQLSTQKFVISQTIHGDNGVARSRYKKINGDVYVAIEDIINGFAPSTNASYILYNESRGLYFHAFYYYEKNKEQSIYYMKRNAYPINGNGFFTKSKKEKLSKSDLELSANVKDNFHKMLEVASEIYNRNDYQHKIALINNKSDEGITSILQRENIGKILFADSVNEENKSISTIYKNTFTLDEPIVLTFFSDKGLNKFINTNDESSPKENLDKDNCSFFDIFVLVDGREYNYNYFKIEHKGNLYKTSGITTLVAPPGSNVSNSLIKGIMPQVVNMETPIKISIKTRGKNPDLVATGSFNYIPKTDAVLSFGVKCLSDDYNDEVKLLKPDLRKNYEIQLAKDMQAKAYKLVGFSIVSGWKTSNGFNTLDLAIVLLAKNGKCFFGNDIYALNKENKNIFHFKMLNNGKLFERLSSNCDCPK